MEILYTNLLEALEQEGILLSTHATLGILLEMEVRGHVKVMVLGVFQSLYAKVRT